MPFYSMSLNLDGLNAIEVKLACLDDLSRITEIHMDIFPQDLSTYLGSRFVRKHYYGDLLRKSSGFGLAAYFDSVIVGFVFGVYDCKKLPFIRKVMYLWYELGNLLANPIESLRWLKLFFSRKAKFTHPYKAELISLGVKKEFQGKGISKLLVSAFKQHLRSSDIRCCWTKTHSPVAVHVYESQGFKSVSNCNAFGREYTFLAWMENCD